MEMIDGAGADRGLRSRESGESQSDSGRQAPCRCHLFEQFFKRQPLLMRVHAGTCFFPDWVMLLRKGRRDGHDSNALFARKVPISNWIQISFTGANIMSWYH